MKKGGKPGKDVPASLQDAFLQDAWADKKRALIATREDLLRLVGNRPGATFDTIRNNWTAVWTRETSKRRAGADIFVPNDKPGEWLIVRQLTRCHELLDGLAKLYKAYPNEHAKFDLDDLTEAEKETIQAATRGARTPR